MAAAAVSQAGIPQGCSRRVLGDAISRVEEEEEEEPSPSTRRGGSPNKGRGMGKGGSAAQPSPRAPADRSGLSAKSGNPSLLLSLPPALPLSASRLPPARGGWCRAGASAGAAAAVVNTGPSMSVSPSFSPPVAIAGGCYQNPAVRTLLPVQPAPPPPAPPRPPSGSLLRLFLPRVCRGKEEGVLGSASFSLHSRPCGMSPAAVPTCTPRPCPVPWGSGLPFRIPSACTGRRDLGWGCCSGDGGA